MAAFILGGKEKSQAMAWLNATLGESELAVVELDDLALLDIARELVALRKANEGALELLSVDFDVISDYGVAIDRLFDDLEGAIALEGDDVVNGAKVRGDIDFLAVDEDVAMVHELAGAGAGPGEAHAINEVIEATFEDAEESKSGDGVFIGFRNLEEAAELTLVHAIKGAELLLLEELGSVFGRLPFAVLAVLARAIGSFLELISRLEDGETKVTGFLPRRFGVPRHISCLLSLRHKVQSVPSIFPGVGFSAP